MALGGGSARGLAHIGVLEAFEEAGLPVDVIAGTSMGAVIGALYAAYRDVERIKRLTRRFGAVRFAVLFEPSLPKTGLIRGRRLEEELKAALGEAQFSDLEMPFACVATDIDNGERVVIRDGLVWEAVRASVSLPVFFSVAKRAGRNLVDGELVDPVPVGVARQLGADLVVAVNATRSRNGIKPSEPNILTVALQVIHIAGNRIIDSCLREADIVIEPDMDSISSVDFHRVNECVQLGKQAAEEMVPEIKRRLAAIG